MNIGTTTSLYSTFSATRLTGSSTSSSELLKSRLKKSEQTTAPNKANGAAPQGSPPEGTRGGMAPRELTADAVGQMASRMKEAGAAGADKLNDLAKSLSDSGSTMSMSDFQSYASANGISMPERPEKDFSVNTALPSGEGTTVQHNAVKASAAGLIAKYSSSVSASAKTSTASTYSTSDTPTASGYGGAKSASSTQSSSSQTSSSNSSTEYSSMTDSELQQLASKGDTQAQDELDNRKAEKKEREGKTDDSSGSNAVGTVDIAV